MCMKTSEIITLIYSGIQAITTVALVVITYKQMKLGRESIESVERSTKANFLPILILGHARHTSNGKVLNIQLINCGKGLAIKPRVTFPGKDDVTLNSIDVGKDDYTTINYDIDFILNKVPDCDRKIIIEYKDVFGRKIITQAHLCKIEKLGPSVDKSGIGWESWDPITP